MSGNVSSQNRLKVSGTSPVVDDRLLHRVREEVAAHRPLGPVLLERRVERRVRVEPARLVDVLDQHQVERRVLLIVVGVRVYSERNVATWALHRCVHRDRQAR